MSSHHQSVHQQFDPLAQAYLHSAVHAQGPDLQHALSLLQAHQPSGAPRILDVGCGGGHLSFTLAPWAHRMVALDPSGSMVDTVAQEATRRGLHQIETRIGQAEALPFDAACFDWVVSRYSAHHWHHLRPALGEIRRVLKPGGYLLMIDVLGAEDPLVDTHLQLVELLRDRSHVRDRSAAEWEAVLAGLGFEVEARALWPLRLQFDHWVERMRTPADKVAILRTVMDEAPAEVRQALHMESDGSFTAQTGLFLARCGR